MIRLLLALTALIVAVGPVGAQLYKWRDPSGRMQYSDTPPPPGAKDVTQLAKPPAAPASSSAAKPAPSLADQDAAFRKRLAEQKEAEAKATKDAQQEEIRARNCEQARGQLQAIDSGSRLVRFNAQGERIALDESERNSARDDALRQIETWCKKQ